jgi:PTS system ascorbate-specific IIB component
VLLVRRLRIVTVCGCGLGSSLMAKVMIEKILADYGMHASIEAADGGTVKGFASDIVVATKAFERACQGLKVPVVIVTSFVNKEELRQKLGAVLQQLAEKEK